MTQQSYYLKSIEAYTCMLNRLSEFCVRVCHINNMLGAEAKVWLSAHVAMHTPRSQYQAEGAPLPAAPAAEARTGNHLPCNSPLIAWLRQASKAKHSAEGALVQLLVHALPKCLLSLLHWFLFPSHWRRL